MPKRTPNPDESLDRLTDRWHIFQLRKGHRFSTDDLVVAWRASLARPHAASVLDLGSGLGTVGLCTLHLLESEPPLLGIEAQDMSVELARKTIEHNDLASRVQVRHGDFRDDGLVEEGRQFELITGSPPYMPLGSGLLSPHPQRAACRHELRGSVFDYCEAARRWLEPGGRFCFVMPTADERVPAAIEAHGFVALEQCEIMFREGRPPLVSTWLVARREDVDPAKLERARFVVRGHDGEWTAEYHDFRALFGVERPAQHTPSV